MNCLQMMVDAGESKVLTYPSVAGDSQYLYPSTVGLEQLSSSLASGNTDSDVTGTDVLCGLNHFFIAQDAVYQELSFYNFKKMRNLLPEQTRNYSLLNIEGERLFLIVDQYQIRTSLRRHLFPYNLTELDGRVLLSFQGTALAPDHKALHHTEVEITSANGDLVGRINWTGTHRKCREYDFTCVLKDGQDKLVGYVSVGNGQSLDYPIYDREPKVGVTVRKEGQIFVSPRQTLRPKKEIIHDYVLSFYETLPWTTRALAIGASILLDILLRKMKKKVLGIIPCL